MAMAMAMEGGARGIPTSAGFINVTVTEPVMHNDTLGSYVSYKINTLTDRHDFPYGQLTVVRRYNDFLWLHEQLTTSFPGAIVAPLPEKNVVRRFSHEFIEGRRRALERFLNRIANHAELVTSPHFHTFLQADDAGLAKAKEEGRSDQSKGGLMQWIDERISSLQSSLQGKEESKTPADVKLEEEAAYINNLETQMNNVCKHASMLVRRNREAANAMFEFGAAITLLGQCETDTLGVAMAHVGRNADQMSVKAAERAENEAQVFEEPLLEYVRLVAAVKAAISRRQDKKLSYAHALSEFEKATMNLHRCELMVGKEDKVASAHAALQKAEQQVQSSKQEYEIVNDRVMRELEKFKAEKAEDMKRVMLQYVQLQLEYSKTMEQVWQNLVPSLQDLAVESPANSRTSTTARAGAGQGSGAELGSHSPRDTEADSSAQSLTFSSAPYSNSSRSTNPGSFGREAPADGGKSNLVGV